MMIDYTHPFVEDLRIMAWKYCEAHVEGFDGLTYEETQWYVESVLKLLLEDKKFVRKAFNTMLN